MHNSVELHDFLQYWSAIGAIFIGKVYKITLHWVHNHKRLRSSRGCQFFHILAVEKLPNSLMWRVFIKSSTNLQPLPRRFFVYEVTSTKFTRELVKEILISLVASVFMGLGTMFLLLWVGIYVWCKHQATMHYKAAFSFWFSCWWFCDFVYTFAAWMIKTRLQFQWFFYFFISLYSRNRI